MLVIRKMSIVTARQMKRWMRILASLILFWTATSESSCRFHSSYRKIYSLSGPVTQILEEWSLLNAPELRGVSVFYPLPQGFKGKKIPGGVFLSPGALEEMKDALVFFDESQELRKLFRARKIEAVEIRTRNQFPGVVAANVSSLLSKYVVECGPEKILAKVKKLEDSILDRMKKKPSIVFFLGEVGKNHLPQFVIASDGLVLWLKKKELISSYPSELGYVSWSGAIIQEMKGKSLFLGIKDDKDASVTGDKERANLTYPGALIPGVRQLEAWNYFLDHRPQ